MRAARILAAILARLVILSAAYFGSIAPASFLSTRPITRLDYFSGDLWAWNLGYWLTQGHLILILFFPAVALSRQILNAREALIAGFGSWGLIALLFGIIRFLAGDLLNVGMLPPREVTASFLAAIAASEFLMWRGLSHRGPRMRDAPLAAALFAILFNVLSFDLDPDLAGARLFTQTAIQAIGAGAIALILKLVFLRSRRPV